MTEQKSPQLTEFHMHIDGDGRWFHEGGEITRKRMVALFATILSCDETGQHWLRTPVEYGRVEVVDAAFIITSMHIGSSTTGQIITMTDNIDRMYEVSAQYPIKMTADKQGIIKPYLLIERGLRARLSHPVYYELAAIAHTDPHTGAVGVTSHNQFFSLDQDNHQYDSDFGNGASP